MSEANGDPKPTKLVVNIPGVGPRELPAIIFGWDEERKQLIMPSPMCKEFPNLEFVSALFGMAKDHVDAMIRVNRMNQMAQQAMEAQQAQAIAQQVTNGRRIVR